MRKDKKMYELIEIVSSLPSDKQSVDAEQLHNKIDWHYSTEMALAGALKTVAKGTKYEEIADEIIDKCCLVTEIEKDKL